MRRPLKRFTGSRLFLAAFDIADMRLIAWTNAVLRARTSGTRCAPQPMRRGSQSRDLESDWRRGLDGDDLVCAVDIEDDVIVVTIF